LIGRRRRPPVIRRGVEIPCAALQTRERQLVSNAAVGHGLAALGIEQRARARWQRREEIFS